MYKVIEYFEDLKDDNYAYHAGDTFPREGVTVTQTRAKELSTSKNRRGRPLIKAVEDGGRTEKTKGNTRNRGKR